MTNPSQQRPWAPRLHLQIPEWEAFFPQDLPTDWRWLYLGHFTQSILVDPDRAFAHPAEWGEIPAHLSVYLDLRQTGCVLEADTDLRGCLCAPSRANGTPTLPQYQHQPEADQQLPEAWLRCFTSDNTTCWLLEPTHTLDPRTWRSLLENLSQSHDLPQQTVFFAVTPAVWETVTTLADLLGLKKR